MDYEVREYGQEYPCRRRAQTETEKEIPPYYMGKVILTQFAVVAILLIVIFALSRSGSGKFASLKDFYNSVMQRDMTASEVFGEVKSVFEFLTDSPLKNAEKSDEENSKEEPATEASAEQTTATDEEMNGAGGEDLIYPKDNTSFSPFYLSMPIVKPVASNRMTSPFGYRINPVTDEYGFHSGLDMAAPTGTPIKAAFDGVVDKAASSPARGNYIMINSSGGIKTVYCHCSELLVTEGQQVTAGEIIAKVGSTGQATGPHLHFELRINGIYYNPIWVIDI